MSAFRCSYLPLYPLKVGHQLGKLCAYLHPSAESPSLPSLYPLVGRVPTSAAIRPRGSSQPSGREATTVRAVRCRLQLVTEPLQDDGL